MVWGFGGEGGAGSRQMGQMGREVWRVRGAGEPYFSLYSVLWKEGAWLAWMGVMRARVDAVPQEESIAGVNGARGFWKNGKLECLGRTERSG